MPTIVHILRHLHYCTKNYDIRAAGGLSPFAFNELCRLLPVGE